METISNAYGNVLTILGKARPSDSGYRLMKYCAQTRVDDGVLLFNLLTRELLLLTDDEYASMTELAYLKDHWFVVPNALDEKKCVDMVRWVRLSTHKKPKAITHYTILTTTDCNARCFYCYELGRSRIPMNEETAQKAAQYIKAHCGGEQVHLSWFGGEPLYNLPVIDQICRELRRDGIAFKSQMTSNGYLFNDDLVKKAVDLWNLKLVQITLDGTEEVYNKCKAFIYREGSAYQVVLRNIERLLDAGVRVAIRLNMDLHNAEDLLTLVDEVANRFADKKGLYIYPHLLFDDDASAHSDQEWTARYEALNRLEDRIAHWNLSTKRGIDKELKSNHCMADSGNAVTIVPTGDIGLCEHHSESEFAGHVDREGLDAAMVASWKEAAPELPECADCFLYPSCLRLKKCTHVCVPQLRESHRRSTELAMRNEYQLWRSQTAPENEEDTEP